MNVDDIYSVDELHTFRDAALAFANEVRERYGAPPLSTLPRGVPDDSSSCPLANALRDCGDPVEVSGCSADINGYTIQYPEEVWEFVEAFDSGRYPDLVEVKD